MIERVLDASVLVKWFKQDAEAGRSESLDLMRRYQEGVLAISVPPLLFSEVLNVAARRWHWDAESLTDLAHQMEAFGFRLQQPGLEAIARWTARGLTAYDASYVALAELRRSVVVTADSQILAVAGELAEPLAAGSSS